jgi:hypothetical protein
MGNRFLKIAESGEAVMGMSSGWISPELPARTFGTQQFALCFWSKHATAVSWTLRFGLSAVGCCIGYWISSYSDGLTEATALKLLTGQQLPMVAYVVARLNPEYFDGLFGAFLGALVAEILLWRGSCWSPNGETAICFCMVYVVFLPWLRYPIFVRPSSEGCRALAPFVCV